MLEKIPSLKDFIIYLMPGLLICYFSFYLLNHFNMSSLTIDQISRNPVLSFLGLVFAFFIGFLSSQLHIILFSRFLRNKIHKMRTINVSLTSEKTQDVLINRIIKEFDLQNVNKNDLLNDNLIIFSCLQYVMIKTNEESRQTINRSKNLSSFAMTLFLPIILGLIYLSINLSISNYIIIGALILVSCLLLKLIFKIILNFKAEYFKLIFRQFLVLSKP